MGRRLIDEAGNRYGRLTVVKRHNVPGPSSWICRCDCGMVVTRYGGDLRRSKGRSSCGCDHHIKHGHTVNSQRSPTYESWFAMKTRIRRKQRGYEVVDMDPRWEDFETFLSDLGERLANTTLDRIDGSRGYWANNCRWATKNQQAWNQKHRYDTEHGFTGVQKNGSNWQAVIQEHGRRHCLGTYPSPEIAALAYNRAARKYHGDDAKQNHIPSLDYYRSDNPMFIERKNHAWASI